MYGIEMLGMKKEELDGGFFVRLWKYREKVYDW